MQRNQKEAVVAEMKDIFMNVTSAVVVDYRGLEANKVVELRKQLQGSASKMRVIKNTLAKIAAKDTPFQEVSDLFVDTRALIYSDDPVNQAKVITEFAKTNNKLQIKGGVLSDPSRSTILSEAEIQDLAKMPSKEELIAKLLFLLNAPITNFVRTLNEIPASFARVLAAIAENKENPSA